MGKTTDYSDCPEDVDLGRKRRATGLVRSVGKTQEAETTRTSKMSKLHA